MIEKFHMLTLVERDVGMSKDGRKLCLWICDCGNYISKPYGRVSKGSPTHCGCQSTINRSNASKTHGGKYSREYSSWQAMRRRCENPDDKDYHRYGAKGISVCREWTESFATFRDHIGPRPKGMTVDRIDTKKGYEPGNVRWATPKTQACNRSDTYVWYIKGSVFISLYDAASHFSVSGQTVHRWVNGAFDKRRGTLTKPRTDCYALEKYPS